MSKVVLIPNGEKVYAVPTEICEKYELNGAVLAAAQEALSPDVEGQGGLRWNGRGECYNVDIVGGVVTRAPQWDR